MSIGRQPGPSARWQASSDVRWLQSDNLVVILSLRSGEYLGLTGSAAAMWSGIVAGQERSALVQDLAGTFDVSTTQLNADLNQFLADCERRGLIHPVVDGDEQPRQGAARSSGWRQRLLSHAPPALHAWLTCVATSLTLSMGGLASAYARAGAGTATPPPSLTDRNQLQRLLAAFRRAEGFLVSRRGSNDCLPRSLALFSFLRARGCATRHIIGVSTSPFVAHAWVEFDDEPLLNQPHEVRRFTPLAVLL